MNNSILECRHLQKTYHDGAAIVEVLQDICLQIYPAEMFAIVGNSGSGKSTLLHLLGGLDNPTAGKVFIQGKDLATLAENEKCKLRNQHLGFVYQFHHLLPEFTALENVCMPLLIGNIAPRIARSKAEYLLELVGLQERLAHKVGELSGGERQRVAIARALIIDPLCVLADEPTGNLDPHNAERIFQLFLNLQQELKMSVIIVTHDMHIAKQVKQTYLLEYGKLVAV